MDAIEPDMWQSDSAHREAMGSIMKALLHVFPRMDSKLVMVTVVRLFLFVWPHLVKFVFPRERLLTV